MLYEYTNKEHDLVRQAFRTGNYHSLRDLPCDLAPYSVSQSVKDRIQKGLLYSNISAANQQVHK